MQGGLLAPSTLAAIPQRFCTRIAMTVGKLWVLAPLGRNSEKASRTAIAVADAINNHVPGNTASALDAATIEIVVPSYRQEELVEFIAEIESLAVKPDYKAKIVINESTGTVVIGDKVNIRPVAIAQGNLIVNVGQLDFDDKYGPETDEKTRDLVSSFVDKRRGRAVHHLQESATLSDLVAGLNKLGVYPRDIINILHSMKSVGALDAVIEVR